MRIAVLGSGFGGSLAARVLNRLDHRVVLVEKGRHPRFALGESTTPLANLGLERLAARYDLPDLHHLAAYGRWLRHLPEVRRGLKRGFTFYGSIDGSTSAEQRALVAASPEDALADSHWLRADVDFHLVERAREEGVEVREEHEIEEIARTSTGTWEIRGCRGNQASQGNEESSVFSLEADFLVDATGPAGVVPRALGVAEVSKEPPERGGLATRSGLVFGHFRGVRRFEEVLRESGAELPAGPYPDDAAAVHHLLDEGWMYVLRFDPDELGDPDGATASAGILFEGGFEGGLPEGEPAALWQGVLERYPSLAASFADAQPLFPLRLQQRIQHRWARAAGEGWVALPHTYGFVEPLFSTGIAWTVLGVERLGRMFEESGQEAPQEPRYEDRLRAEVERIDGLVHMAYRARGCFPAFVAVGLLYFAAVSFAESRRRLVDPAEDPRADDPCEGFLGVGDPVLDALFEEAPERLAKAMESQEVAAFEDWIQERIRPRDVAGLADGGRDPGRQYLYPVDFEALVEAAPRLGLTPGQVRERLCRLRSLDSVPPDSSPL